MGPLEFYIIRQTLLTVERVDKLKNVEWYKPVYICAFAGYAKITSSAQKVYTDMLFLALNAVCLRQITKSLGPWPGWLAGLPDWLASPGLA